MMFATSQVSATKKMRQRKDIQMQKKRNSNGWGSCALSETLVCILTELCVERKQAKHIVTHHRSTNAVTVWQEKGKASRPWNKVALTIFSFPAKPSPERSYSNECEYSYTQTLEERIRKQKDCLLQHTCTYSSRPTTQHKISSHDRQRLAQATGWCSAPSTRNIEYRTHPSHTNYAATWRDRHLDPKHYPTIIEKKVKSQSWDEKGHDKRSLQYYKWRMSCLYTAAYISYIYWWHGTSRYIIVSLCMPMCFHSILKFNTYMKHHFPPSTGYQIHVAIQRPPT